MWPFAHQDFETALLILVENEKHLVAIEQCSKKDIPKIENLRTSPGMEIKLKKEYTATFL